MRYTYIHIYRYKGGYEERKGTSAISNYGIERNKMRYKEIDFVMIIIKPCLGILFINRPGPSWDPNVGHSTN